MVNPCYLRPTKQEYIIFFLKFTKKSSGTIRVKQRLHGHISVIKVENISVIQSLRMRKSTRNTSLVFYLKLDGSNF